MSSEQPAPLVPRLRFPEFQEAGPWCLVSLGKAATPVTETVGDRKLTPVSISAGVGFVPQAEKFGRDISGDQYRRYLRVRDGDFVYNKGNSLRFPEGCVYLLKGWGEVAAPNVFISFRLKQGYSNGFFQACFEFNLHGQQLKRHITSGARSNGLLNISKEAFYGLRIPTPGSAEQQKIADCLNSLDELIAAKGRRVDALKAQKNGLMRELLPRERETQPRYRFLEFESTGPWVERTLSDLLEIKHGYAFEGEFYSTSGDYVLLTPGNFCEQGGYRDRGVNQKYYVGPILRDYVLNRGDLLVAMTEQAAGLLGSPIIVPSSNKFLHNQRLGLLKTREGVALTSDFLFHVFNTQRVRTAISASASGAKVRHTSPNKIGEVVFAFPSSFEEQRRIASCLGDLDGLIAQEVRELDTLQMHKKALTQQLFPSTEALAA